MQLVQLLFPRQITALGWVWKVRLWVRRGSSLLPAARCSATYIDREDDSLLRSAQVCAHLKHLPMAGEVWRESLPPCPSLSLRIHQRLAPVGVRDYDCNNIPSNCESASINYSTESMNSANRTRLLNSNTLRPNFALGFSVFALQLSYNYCRRKSGQSQKDSAKILLCL